MKRYQVFISSTYTDLKEERSAVQRSVLKLRHIPVGMEQFVASNEEQFSYIKKLLEDTDYYIVIVGNRYGSIADDGLSYTEKEFDYAVSLGIPVIACVHSNPNAFPVDKSDTDKKSIEKLKKFREKIMKNRLVSYIDWTTPEALTSEVVVALVNVINDYPRPGWERAGSYDKSDLLSQINELRIENNQLKLRIKEIESQEYENEMICKFPWEDKVRLHVRLLYEYIYIFEFTISWKELLGIFGSILFTVDDLSKAHEGLSKAIFKDKYPALEITDDDYQMIISKLGWIGVVEISAGTISLTKDGKKLLRSEEMFPTDWLEAFYQYIGNINDKISLIRELLSLKYNIKYSSSNKKVALNRLFAFLKDKQKEDYSEDLTKEMQKVEIQLGAFIVSGLSDEQIKDIILSESDMQELSNWLDNIFLIIQNEILAINC